MGEAVRNDGWCCAPSRRLTEPESHGVNDTQVTAAQTSGESGFRRFSVPLHWRKCLAQFPIKNSSGPSHGAAVAGARPSIASPAAVRSERPIGALRGDHEWDTQGDRRRTHRSPIEATTNGTHKVTDAEPSKPIDEAPQSLNGSSVDERLDALLQMIRTWDWRTAPVAAGPPPATWRHRLCHPSRHPHPRRFVRIRSHAPTRRSSRSRASQTRNR